jgi:hypothetical protein
MIADLRPDWIILDPIASFAPDIEENKSVTLTYQRFRNVIKDYSTSITSVHHPRKPSTHPQARIPDLEIDPHGWFLQTRGARQLINGADIRLGIDKCRRAESLTELDGRSVEVALMLAGFGRLRGTIEPVYVGRLLGDDDEPMGYAQLHGASLLFNTERQSAFESLPDQFTFKQAKQTLRKGSQATSDFLRKCQSVGILRKEGRQYRKIKVAEPMD